MPSSALPEQIHRYHILSELGRGSMGRVYLARDPRIDRRIALKVFSPRRLCEEDEEEELRERFLRESRTAGRLQHPGIVTVYDADVDPESGEPYLAMEWVAGQTLRRLLKKEGALPVLVAIDLAIQVARALDYAHRREVVHRDIKPANLLVADDGRVKITDFGIAKIVSDSLTLTGHVLGSPYYMAPEQVRAEPTDGRTDLFALGAVLYEGLTGRLAFGGDSLANVTFKILSVDPRPPEIYNPSLPPTLRAVLDRTLAKSPDDRYQSGAELAEALESVTRQLGGRVPRLASHESSSSLRPLADVTTRYLDRSRSSSRGRARPKRLTRLAALGLAALALLVVALRLNHFDDVVPDLGPAAGTGISGNEGAADRRPKDDLDDGDDGGVGDAVAGDHGGAEGPLLCEEPAGPAAPLTFLPDVLRTLSEEPLCPATAEAARRPETAAGGEARIAELEPSIAAVPEAAVPRAAVPQVAVPQARAEREASPEPKPEIRSAGPPADAGPPANLEIRFENRLKVAYIAGWVDGQRVFFERLEAGMLKRWFGKMFRQQLVFPQGHHTVEIHVSGVSRKLEARRAIRSYFSSREPRALRVRLDRSAATLDLSWEQAAGSSESGSVP